MKTSHFPTIVMTYEEWNEFQAKQFPKLKGSIISVTSDPRTFGVDGALLGNESETSRHIHTFWLPGSVELMDVMYAPGIGTLKETIDDESEHLGVAVLCLVGFTGITKERIEEAVLSGELLPVLEAVGEKLS